MVMLFAISLVNKPFFISTILARERERQNGQLIPAQSAFFEIEMKQKRNRNLLAHD